MFVGKDDRYEEIVTQIGAATSLAAMQELAAGICKAYHLANMAYHALYIPGAKAFNPILVLTYDPDWIARYKSNDYFKIDPVVACGTKSFLPLDWSHLDRESAVARDFFAEANRFDVGRQGMTLPVRGAGGERALLTITANMPPAEWEGRRIAYMKEFQMIAHYMHDRIVELSGYRQAAPKPILSAREMECLELAARGAAAKQIAGRLQISDRAVRLFLSSACAKLRCANVHQAVAKMVTLEMLRP
ncbi:helix-turn-helix transcriptional regulator [Acidiphilium multivorum]|jgi:DNA-binding CsgD family transcriptional regulator|uniref:helix-turn-helix transcriptional regulator n=1 Tax=Acidiphilium multivorum TaxID=62140 RepID=UPI0039C96C2E